MPCVLLLVLDIKEIKKVNWNKGVGLWECVKANAEGEFREFEREFFLLGNIFESDSRLFKKLVWEQNNKDWLALVYGCRSI